MKSAVAAHHASANAALGEKIATLAQMATTMIRRERMGVEPTAPRSARRATSFEDWGDHRAPSAPKNALKWYTGIHNKSNMLDPTLTST
jgi:hypothetical protein